MDINIVNLDKKLAIKYLKEILELLNLIPMVTYVEQDIFAEKKGNRKMLGKWNHSLVAFDKDNLTGIIIGYEREAEQNDQYPSNTIYISELAVKSNYQNKGIGSKLLKKFIEHNKNKGLIYLKGNVNFSVQTNSAEWNKKVVELYENAGFIVEGIKSYENRVDNIMRLKK
jgi:ribosomal protein S18 acetylase RimI-like enzyme